MKAHVWLRKKDDMSSEEFADYFMNTHAKLVTDGYPRLAGYRVSITSRTAAGEEAPYDAVSELAWESKDDFRADVASGGERLAADLENFASAWGLVFIEEHAVK